MQKKTCTNRHHPARKYRYIGLQPLTLSGRRCSKFLHSQCISRGAKERHRSAVACNSPQSPRRKRKRGRVRRVIQALSFMRFCIPIASNRAPSSRFKSMTCVCLAFRLRLLRKRTIAAMIVSKATPPITPPAMAPA